MESKLPSKYKTFAKYIYPVSLIVLAALIFLLVIFPTLSDTLTIKATADTNAIIVDNLNQKIAFLQGANVAQLNDDLSKVTAALPSNKDVAGFLADINQNATAAGDKLAAVQLIPSVVAGTTAGALVDTNMVEFQVSVQGSYPQVRDFLRRTETTRRVMAVKTITVATNPGQANVTAVLTLDTYYLPVPSVVAGNTNPLPVRTVGMTKALTQVDSRTVYSPPIGTPSSTGRADPFADF